MRSFSLGHGQDGEIKTATLASGIPEGRGPRAQSGLVHGARARAERLKLRGAGRREFARACLRLRLR